jgi:maltooligosyltrehalose trehalohydrolase
MSDAPQHVIPFGAALEANGARFRLWAPSARTVELQLLDGKGRTLPMSARGDGWFEAIVADARAGARYRYFIDGQSEAPDPASRFQPEDVLGPSLVVDPDAYVWTNDDWRGRPWSETILYELHVGAFTPEGTFDGVRERLEHIANLGVTAIELMPIGDFSGSRNWGYDGALPFAPDSAYGDSRSLKRLIDAAHGRGLMVFLDVVYNHFGPEGNFLELYAEEFFSRREKTPWGKAIDFSRKPVRDFFIHNALYWLEEYRFDGLRLDAVHSIRDDGAPHILEELARTVHRQFDGRRLVHLVLENEDNQARYLGAPAGYRAQWNDDFHHACHILATGEAHGYYEDYKSDPVGSLLRCLAEGFAYQGEPSMHRGGRLRGERSAALAPTAFVNFLQNHDQIGNRAMGERLCTLAPQRVLKALAAILLLAPSPPMLFMGEEWGARVPFFYFCDFRDELATAVREGRRKEFSSFPAFREEAMRARIPDPNAETTFAASRLDWSALGESPHKDWLDYYRRLLQIRRREIVPRLAGISGNAARAERLGDADFQIDWRLNGAELRLRANLSDARGAGPALTSEGRVIFAQGEGAEEALRRGAAAPWSVVWSMS